MPVYKRIDKHGDARHPLFTLLRDSLALFRPDVRPTPRTARPGVVCLHILSASAFITYRVGERGVSLVPAPLITTTWLKETSSIPNTHGALASEEETNTGV